jgi:diacylglycerol kinase family enzyme
MMRMASPVLADHAPFHIVFNAASGSGDAASAQAIIEEVLSSSGRRYELLPIDDPKNIAAISRRAASAAMDSGGAVIVAGGDGTINAVAQAVLPTQRPFGIVPQGTFNYSSRAHGIPLDTRAAVEALLHARPKPVQVGTVNERIFLVNASVGLYPQLLQDREEYKRQYGRRRTVALWAGLVTLLREHRQLVLEIEHDSEREIVRTPSLFIGNNPLQLEQVGLPEAQDVQRRRLAAVVVRSVSTPRLLWLALRGALGQLGEDEHVVNFPFRRMTVRSLQGHGRSRIKVAADGEIFWTPLPLEFGLAPQPLMLMVPPERAVESK